ncbi:MAG: M20 family metallopeptidase [Chloroflexi bacterium]|nr:M20 family metallopeptidase [Chloroflexota bacterium]MCI0576474.1 M20 family metallopeptidase [Chloroflexota bacterium]MCI0649550.1 M20 family metallopeptidase [Chloroflexota bacterium]MCI0729374.1 M20 family metallopeptidase [Chloroflexota bacterium]
MDRTLAGQLLATLSQQEEEMVAFLRRLVLAESPSSTPEAQAQVLAIVQEALQELDYEVELVSGQTTGGHLVARPSYSPAAAPRQLLLGHCDTVWPLGALREMPFSVNGNVMKGPGVYDMKGGLAQMVFALRAIRALGLEPVVRPVVLVNSDEEIGSEESTPHIRQLAQEVERAFVLEPSLGPAGWLKTARKGVGRYQVVANGRAAHAGLDPEKGVSAVLELSYVIQKLFAMNDPARGVSVNVGIVEGGVRSNVVAPHGRAVVDVRVPTQEEARRVETAILGLRPELAGATLEVQGRMTRPPLERTPANQALWQMARRTGRLLGLELEEGAAGGGSDGNTTSLYTATLDGLGPVGDGAHAQHEFIYRDKMVERAALLALLVLAPPRGRAGDLLVSRPPESEAEAGDRQPGDVRRADQRGLGCRRDPSA